MKVSSSKIDDFAARLELLIKNEFLNLKKSIFGLKTVDSTKVLSLKFKYLPERGKKSPIFGRHAMI